MFGAIMPPMSIFISFKKKRKKKESTQSIVFQHANIVPRVCGHSRTRLFRNITGSGLTEL